MPRWLALPSLALALSSCASPGTLAHQSTQALERGDLQTAYDKSLRAVEKDPQLQPARDAYAAASARVAADYRSRVIATASGDTLAGANLALDYRRFRAEVTRHGTSVDSDPTYDRAESAIMTGAARIHYQRGMDAMASERPRVAVDAFSAARQFDQNFSDVSSRLNSARQAATVRIALLPIIDGVGMSGLSQEISDIAQRELSRAAPEFRYTNIIPGADVERTMTVAEFRNMRRADVTAIGGRLGADWVVVGRFQDVHASGTRHTSRVVIHHRIDSKDAQGNVTVSRWVQDTVPIVTRERSVTVIFDFDIVSVSTGAVLAHREQPSEAIARVTWTDYKATDDHYDRYALLPPDVRRGDPERGKKADAEWRAAMGTWDLKDFMRSTRDERGRTRYTPQLRDEFTRNTREHPVWLNDLPSDRDLAFVAMKDAWRGIVAALKELDSAK